MILMAENRSTESLPAAFVGPDEAVEVVDCCLGQMLEPPREVAGV